MKMLWLLLRKWQQSWMHNSISRMTETHYLNCKLCPRNCGTDRTTATGYCGCGSFVKAARAGIHLYEEPFLSGKKGSGTVFFSGCSMKCVFCQNIELSRDAFGYEIGTERLAEIFLEQQDRGAHNINLVTGTHFTPSIAEAIRMAKQSGLKIPVVWNSSGYEKVDTLRMLEGLVDIWMPDLKTLSRETAERYYKEPNYPAYAKKAIEYMASVTTLRFENDLMKSGVIVRHLMMPGAFGDTKKVLRYLKETFGNQIWISLMNQYTPMGEMPYEELKQRVSKRAYEKAVDYAIELGIEQCMIQEGGTVSESFIPVFDGTGILKNKIKGQD